MSETLPENFLKLPETLQKIEKKRRKKSNLLSARYKVFMILSDKVRWYKQPIAISIFPNPELNDENSLID